MRLRGRRTNSMGVGARVAIHARTGDNRTVVRRAVMNNKTGFGSAPYLLHVGLRDAARIDSIEVRWPVSRCVHSYPAAINRVNVFDEAECWGDVSATPQATDSR